MFLEQKTFVTISCSFFKIHSIFDFAIFSWPYMNKVSKKIATSKIECIIKNLQLIVTNLFLTNNLQKDPPKRPKIFKKSIFSALGLYRDLGFSQGPQTHLFPLFWILPTHLITQKNTRKRPQKPPNFQKFQKIKFLSFGTR